MKSHLEKINNFIGKLDPFIAGELNKVSKIKQFKKGDFLLQAGDVCRFSFSFISGIARKYYLQEGKEITTELFFKEDIAISFQSYTLQTPGKEFIQVIEDATVSALDYQELQKLKLKYPALMELDLMLTEYYAMWLEDRLYQFHSLEAKERYLKLMQDHPHILQKIQLTHIASYLGISLETLSRIRAKI